jgi:hypothetical protein
MFDPYPYFYIFISTDQKLYLTRFTNAPCLRNMAMNTRFAFAFIRHLNRKSSGFAMLFALSVGLMLIVLGLTMVLRSQSDTSKSFAQKAKTKGLTAAEMGLTYVQELLNDNRIIATYSSHCTGGNTNCWENIDPTGTSSNIPEFQKQLAYAPTMVCSQSESPEQRRERLQNIVDLTHSNPEDLNTWENLSKGYYYRLISYEYQPDSSTEGVLGKGIVTIEGLHGQDHGRSRARLRVEIPIKEAEAPTILSQDTAPGLWVRRGAVNKGTLETSTTTELGNGQSFRSNVLINDCNVNESLIEQIKVERIPSDSTYQEVAQLNVVFPETPQPPNNAIQLVSNSLHFTPEDGEKLLTFPRTQDGSREVYEYVVDAIDLKGNQVIIITPGAKVTFFVRGNIDIGGTAGIRHNCTGVSNCKPTDFQIYGLAQDLTPTNLADNPYINLSGNSELDAFIFAPDYDAGVNGGSVGAVLRGSLWVNTWSKTSETSSSSQHVAILQTAQWAELPSSVQPPMDLVKLGSISSWKEESVD